MFGAVCAVLVRNMRCRLALSDKPQLLYAGWAMGSGLLLLGQLEANHWLNSLFFPLVAWCSSCALLLAVLHPHTGFSRLLTLGWLRWLGSIAYGTYLIHNIVRDAIWRLYAQFWTQPTAVTEWGVSVCGIATSLLLAWLSWTLLEKRILTFAHSTGKNEERRMVASAAAEG